MYYHLVANRIMSSFLAKYIFLFVCSEMSESHPNEDNNKVYDNLEVAGEVQPPDSDNVENPPSSDSESSARSSSSVSTNSGHINYVSNHIPHHTLLWDHLPPGTEL